MTNITSEVRTAAVPMSKVLLHDTTLDGGDDDDDDDDGTTSKGGTQIL